MNARRMIPLLLIVATVAVYAPVSRYEFVNYDDPDNVYDNAYVRSGLTTESVHWAFTNGKVGMWIPLTWLSLLVDSQFYGLHAGGYHVTNLLLHVVNTLLLYGVLRRMTGAVWQSGFVAALFALHPFHVESVAWVTERRDVLSTCFWLLTMWAYADYVRQPSRSRYLWVWLLYALGLMAKPMLVTLPFVLLLLDVWPLERRSSWRQLVLEKVPLLLFAAIAGIVSLILERRIGAVMAFEHLSLQARLANAAVAYVRYLGKTFWPVNLAVFYPYQAWTNWQVAGALVLLCGVTVLAFRWFKRRPWFVVGWFWFLGVLLPVSGLMQAGSQSMADHYSYVSLIGLFIIVAWGVREVVLLPAGCLVVAACLLVSHRQLQYWQNSNTLFEHALAVTQDNWPAHNGLGIAAFHTGKLEEARGHFLAAIQINPGQAALHQNLGNVLVAEGRLPAAIAEYRVALQLKPNDPDIRRALATAYYNLAGSEPAGPAIQHLQAALHFQPDDPQAHYNLANLLPAAAAIPHYEAALRVRPGHARTHTNLANALLTVGRRDEAIAHYREALRLDPQQAEAQHNLSVALADQKPDL